jgi:ubiquinone/menaquinone biosynthesis C-methylase UbiE
MSSHYDHYDYPAYWVNRQYEHKCEEIAINHFLAKCESIKNVLDIGCGYGRLSKTYLHRAKKIYLSDPSSKLLSLARKNLKRYKKTTFVHSTLENLKNQIPNLKFDLVLFVRVMHHIEDPQTALKKIDRFINHKGYLILEIPNKRHIKALICQFLKGNFTYSLDIFPKDIRCTKNIRNKSIPFINYHPDIIQKNIKDLGYKIIEVRSVSNFRLRHLKRIFPTETLLKIEKKLQAPLGRLFFGPSIFILAQKQ